MRRRLTISNWLFLREKTTGNRVRRTHSPRSRKFRHNSRSGTNAVFHIHVRIHAHTPRQAESFPNLGTAGGQCPHGKITHGCHGAAHGSPDASTPGGHYLAALGSHSKAKVFRGRLRAGLLNFDLSPKPAYTALQTLTRTEWHTRATLDYRDGAINRFKGFYGDSEAVIETARGTVTRRIRLCRGAINAFHLAVE